MGRRAMAAAIIYRQMLPSSAFFALFPRYLRNPGPLRCLRPFDRGIEILGLLIYTYETKQSRLKITGVFGDLRGKMCTEKRGVRNAVGPDLCASCAAHRISMALQQAEEAERALLA